MTDENRELLPQYTRQAMNFSYGNPVITHSKNLDSAKYFADPRGSSFFLQTKLATMVKTGNNNNNVSLSSRRMFRNSFSLLCGSHLIEK